MGEEAGIVHLGRTNARRKRNLSERFIRWKNPAEIHCAVCLKFMGKMACFFIGNQRKFLKKCKKTLAISVFILYNNTCCDIEC